MPFDFGSKNNSSNKLLKAIQSKKKEMNNFLFWQKITKESSVTKIEIPM